MTHDDDPATMSGLLANYEKSKQGLDSIRCSSVKWEELLFKFLDDFLWLQIPD